MAIITFWNDGKVETGQSMTIAAVATSLAIEYNLKILIFNTKYNDHTLEWAFENKNSINSMFTKGKIDLNEGLSGVAKAIASNKTSPEIITNYTKIILKDFELLTNKNTTLDDFKKHMENAIDIIKLANRYYDLVFVDLEGNIEYQNIVRMLESSNVNVITLTQNINAIDQYLMYKSKNPTLKQDNIMISINRYDEKSKYTIRNISKYIKEKKIFGIPYNTLYGMDSCEGKVVDYFIKFKGVSNSNINAPFINSVHNEAEEILDTIKKQQIKKY